MARFSISGGGDGEGSSRSRKRQRFRSIVEDKDGEAKSTGLPNAGSSREEDEEEEGTRNRRREGENNGGMRSAESDQRGENEDEEEDEDEVEDGGSSDDDNDHEEAMMTERGSVNHGDLRDSSLTVTLTDPDVLDCLVCYEPLSIPIFQCDNGHIACSSCCSKLRHKCPSCLMPIGYYRCRAMERVIEAARIPCPNAKYGCTENLSYGERSPHEKKCIFTQCSCPVRSCNFTSSYKHLNNHFSAEHNSDGYVFSCGKPQWFNMRMNEMQVFQKVKDGDMIVVQSFGVPNGICFSVSCVSPSAPGVCEYSYSLKAFLDASNSLKFKSTVKKVQRVSFDPPVECFMLIPSYLLVSVTSIHLRLCIIRSEP